MNVKTIKREEVKKAPITFVTVEFTISELTMLRDAMGAGPKGYALFERLHRLVEDRD